VRLFLDNEFAAAERGRLLSVVLFDLDHFKAYNDQWGHAGGDEALRAFANILAAATRRMDLSARFGGEEFLSVLTSTDTEGALIFAERIRAGLAAATLGTGGHLTVSAGLATYHPSMRSPDELLAAADQALYQAKREGRNRVRLFSPAMMDHALPSPDAAEGLREILGGPEPSDYPRMSEDIGRTRPPLTLLPHQITGFGVGHRVLVVEDDSQVRSLLVTYLSREGFRVTEAVDVASGIETLAQEFDVVVSDIRLPGASGIDLVAAVKSRWPGTPVLVITGLQDAQVAAAALNAGADGYLFKPFGMPDLRRHLIGALEGRDRRIQERASRHSLSGGALERERRAQVAILRAVRALAEAVEMRVASMRGHGSRVAAYAERIADVLDPSAEDIPRDALRLACEVHDVGKIGVSQALLDKDGPLDPEEMDALRVHPSHGRKILEPLLEDEHVLAVVTWHHERWDGAGYPDGLKGDAIPLAARLVGVCDALDAMTVQGPQGAPRPWRDVVQEIREEAGKQFDPAVVRAAEACLDDLRVLAQRGAADATPEAG
jgi:putative two-component system response regulator